MRLNLFLQHITFKCVKVVNSMRGEKEDETSFWGKQPLQVRGPFYLWYEALCPEAETSSFYWL